MEGKKGERWDKGRGVKMEGGKGGKDGRREGG